MPMAKRMESAALCPIIVMIVWDKVKNVGSQLSLAVVVGGEMLAGDQYLQSIFEQVRF